MNRKRAAFWVLVASSLTLSTLQLCFADPTDYQNLPIQSSSKKGKINLSNDSSEIQDKLGLTEDQLLEMARRADTAYQPYNLENAQKQVKKKKNGEALSLLKADQMSKMSDTVEDENVYVFEGKTGNFGLKKKSILGFIEYRPSELERELKDNPDLIHDSNAMKKFKTDRALVIAFRGTKNSSDVITDISAKKSSIKAKDFGISSPDKKTSISIHSGVLSAVKSAFPEIESQIKAINKTNLSSFPPEIQQQLKNNTNLVITGHSLGGAMAQVAGYVLAQRADLSPNKPQVFSFNAPRVGGQSFVKDLEIKGVKLFRVHQKGDQVSKMPPKKLDFEHAGIALYLENPQYCERGKLGRNLESHQMSSLIQNLEAAFAHIPESNLTQE
jgi:hypothetical protein